MSSSADFASCDSSHYTSGSSDAEASETRNAMADINSKLKELTFNYSCGNCGNACKTDPREVGVEITSFNSSKITIRRNEQNPCDGNIFYDDRLFVLKLKSFSGIIKRSRKFRREKYVKIKDKCVSKMLWQVNNIICHIIGAQERAEKGKQNYSWFNEWNKVFLNFLDGRPRMRKTHYFEDVCIAITGATCLNNKGPDLEFRLNSEIVAAKSRLL